MRKVLSLALVTATVLYADVSNALTYKECASLGEIAFEVFRQKKTGVNRRTVEYLINDMIHSGYINKGQATILFKITDRVYETDKPVNEFIGDFFKRCLMNGY